MFNYLKAFLPSSFISMALFMILMPIFKHPAIMLVTPISFFILFNYFRKEDKDSSDTQDEDKK